MKIIFIYFKQKNYGFIHNGTWFIYIWNEFYEASTYFRENCTDMYTVKNVMKIEI
jgi:hypothetical protein